MNKRQDFARRLGLMLYVLGILIGMALAAGVTWSDLEASLFDPGITPNSPLRTLRCPVAITRHETGKIAAALKNSTDVEKNFYTRAHTSQGYVTYLREERKQIRVASGEKGVISWEIYPEDAAFHRLVLFRVYVNAAYPIPSQGSSCGVLVLDIPLLTGTQFFFVLLGLSLAGVIGANVLWQVTNRPMSANLRNMREQSNALAIIVFGALAAGYIGSWILGVVLCAISLLLLGVIIGRTLQ